MRIGALSLTVLAFALVSTCGGLAVSAQAADDSSSAPRAEGSKLAGLGFGDKPYALADDGTFTEVMNKIARERQRICGAVEAFGWEIEPNDQRRIDKLTGSLEGALRKNGFTIKPIKSTQVSRDAVLLTADRTDRRLIVLESLSPATAPGQKAQLVLLLCDTSH